MKQSYLVAMVERLASDFRHLLLLLTAKIELFLYSVIDLLEDKAIGTLPCCVNLK